MSAAHSPNRASRLAIRARLDLADHAADLLHSKEDALQRERTRLEGHAARTEELWHRQYGIAASRLLRARALGASGELTTALDAPRQQAAVTIGWQVAMGVTYPGEVTCSVGSAPALASTVALVPATEAYRAALAAGAEHAAARAALDRLEAELSQTRRRRRAIEQRLRPRLQSQLHQLDLELDERDRATALLTQLTIRKDRSS